MERSSRLVIGLCLLATWTIWGSTYLAIKFALVSFPPFSQMGSRFLVAGLIVLLWSRRQGSPWPSRSEWRNAAIVSVLMMVGGMGCTAYAEQTISSSLAVVFVGTMPMLMILFSLWFGVRPDAFELAGLAVGFAGVLLLVRGQGFVASPVALGAMCTAAVGWSLGSVLSRHRLRPAPGSMGYASQMLCGGVGLTLVALLAGEHFAWPPQTTATLAWIYLVVFGSLIAFNAYMYLLARVRPGTASSYTLVNPVVGLALGATIAGETLSPREWAASGVILSGVVLLLWGAIRRTRT
ncbi:MAG: drug/metabolite exporter YedA [Bryobacteraceae bacterium]|nr:drug/metabolite exporter YedA [Bryobacteraceae bacterium]